MRFIAVDWSGAVGVSAQRRGIWAAVGVDGSVVSLEGGRTRSEVMEWLVSAADASTVIGLDFSFGFPSWWVRSCAVSDGRSMWSVVSSQGEGWLSSCAPPFWGRPGRGRPAASPARAEYRRTELACAASGFRPKSTFQVGGSGSVGTGSIRGMPWLAWLRSRGMAVWPFDPWPSDRPVVVEVYPRLSTGPVQKSKPLARAAEVGRRRWPAALAESAVASEDAFDAACTAAVMSGGWSEPGVVDEVDRMEGRMLTPATPATPAMPAKPVTPVTPLA